MRSLISILAFLTMCFVLGLICDRGDKRVKNDELGLPVVNQQQIEDDKEVIADEDSGGDQVSRPHILKKMRHRKK